MMFDVTFLGNAEKAIVILIEEVLVNS